MTSTGDAVVDGVGQRHTKQDEEGKPVWLSVTNATKTKNKALRV